MSLKTKGALIVCDAIKNESYLMKIYLSDNTNYTSNISDKYVISEEYYKLLVFEALFENVSSNVYLNTVEILNNNNEVILGTWVWGTLITDSTIKIVITFQLYHD